jgi:hypothetical protein
MKAADLCQRSPLVGANLLSPQAAVTERALNSGQRRRICSPVGIFALWSAPRARSTASFRSNGRARRPHPPERCY